MYLIKAFESYFISFSVLLVILIHSRLRKSNSNITSKIFKWLILSDMAGLVLEYLAWFFNGRMDNFSFSMLKLTNVLLFIVCPLPLILWLLYEDYQIFSNTLRLKKTVIIISVFYSYIVIISILSVFTGWFFYFNIQNEYVRGSHFFHSQIISSGFYLYSIYLPIKNRNLISRRYLIAMIKFLIPALVGISLQMIFYGLSLIFSSTSISILIIYLSIQNRDLERDYLTGLYNRMELDKFLSRKIKDKSKIWGALMLDIDDFKKINDNYGHITGDRAIIRTSEIIKNCFHADDFISRFGGDEFVVILDIKEETDLHKVTERLQSKFDDYNKSNESPYELSISIGSSLYDRDKYKNPDEFIHFIDSTMYKSKRRNHN